ncbi:hypothetical protein BV22DRAFT_1028181 [Leucogyrophana mollusca]|uniref:Uncharacterized protein n=1 Tax=Leucogyrophana mollusca TaxID=85980 RepID=A0ACB8BYJ0_9AGAM|nr:hypothetical protein BV22DRAFT_1028181 [Leucogyrophana mollusca]
MDGSSAPFLAYIHLPLRSLFFPNHTDTHTQTPLSRPAPQSAALHTSNSPAFRPHTTRARRVSSVASGPFEFS